MFKTAFQIIRWLLGLFIILLGIVGIKTTGLYSWIIFITLGLLITPLSDKYLFTKLKYKFPLYAKILLAIALFMAFGYTLPEYRPQTTPTTIITITPTHTPTPSGPTIRPSRTPTPTLTPRPTRTPTPSLTPRLTQTPTLPLTPKPTATTKPIQNN